VAEAWEQAITYFVGEDYWLNEVLSSQRTLAVRWLIAHASLESALTISQHYDASLRTASNHLSPTERIEILESLASSEFLSELVHRVVGDDSEAFRYLLRQPHLRVLHLAPLGEWEDKEWVTKAKLAMSAGYSADDVVVGVMNPLGRVTATFGPMSAFWSDWVARFECLTATDEQFERIRDEGIRIATSARDQAIERENREAVFGLNDE
jgi:hypothetical protein